MEKRIDFIEDVVKINKAVDLLRNQKDPRVIKMFEDAKVSIKNISILLDKEDPKPIFKFRRGSEVNCCGNCKQAVLITSDKRFCGNCGHRIEWSIVTYQLGNKTTHKM